LARESEIENFFFEEEENKTKISMSESLKAICNFFLFIKTIFARDGM
jgi:hypothetical protein